MARVITGQTIASTHVDSSGEQITREQLQHLFDQIPAEYVAATQHDLSKPPIAKGFNKRLEVLPDGELAIKLDIEILDEEAFAEMGGFSIAFTRKTIRLGDGEPLMRILVNPQQFDFQEVLRSVEQIIPLDATVDITERVEKGDFLRDAIIIVTVFAFSHVAGGFFGAIGQDLHGRLKTLRRKDHPEGRSEIHLDVHFSETQHFRVFLVITEEVSPAEVGGVDIGQLSSLLALYPQARTASRIVGKLLPGPVVEIDFFVMPDGMVIHPEVPLKMSVRSHRLPNRS